MEIEKALPPKFCYNYKSWATSTCTDAKDEKGLFFCRKKCNEGTTRKLLWCVEDCL